LPRLFTSWWNQGLLNKYQVSLGGLGGMDTGRSVSKQSETEWFCVVVAGYKIIYVCKSPRSKGCYYAKATRQHVATNKQSKPAHADAGKYVGSQRKYVAFCGLTYSLRPRPHPQVSFFERRLAHWYSVHHPIGRLGVRYTATE